MKFEILSQLKPHNCRFYIWGSWRVVSECSWKYMMAVLCELLKNSNNKIKINSRSSVDAIKRMASWQILLFLASVLILNCRICTRQVVYRTQQQSELNSVISFCFDTFFSLFSKTNQLRLLFLCGYAHSPHISQLRG